MLFCVTTRGRERTFNKPRDSAMVSRTSICMVLVAFTKDRPLVGPTAPRFENNGIELPLPVDPVVTGYKGSKPLTEMGEVPGPDEVGTPPTPVVPLPQPKPSCTPMSR